MSFSETLRSTCVNQPGGTGTDDHAGQRNCFIQGRMAGNAHC